MKVGLIGAGAVARACLLAMVARGSAREIVVVDRTPEHAQGMVTDLRYGAPLAPPVTLRAGGYADLAGAGLVMVTSGVNEKSGGATDRNDPEGRLKLLAKNAAVYRDIVPRIASHAGDAILLVVTDPPDALADIARPIAGAMPVLSAGTFLDTLRFRCHIAHRLGVHPASVDALVLGEHGTSSVFVWSSARVGGVPVADLLEGGADAQSAIEKEVREANIEIIEGIGASQFGIGMVSARIAEVIARDERAVLPIGCLSDDYGVTLSVPVVLGHKGVVRALTPTLSPAEAAALRQSASHIRQALDKAGR
jgi:L-lactate dehydrogenase